MEQEKEKNEETFVKKVVQTALEAERQIRRQQVLHNTRMLMEEYIEMKDILKAQYQRKKN